VKSRDHILWYRLLHTLVVAYIYYTRCSGNAISKQRVAVTGDPGSEVRRSRVAVSPAACLGSSVRISCEAQR
jgi:hypothetical protein